MELKSDTSIKSVSPLPSPKINALLNQGARNFFSGAEERKSFNSKPPTGKQEIESDSSDSFDPSPQRENDISLLQLSDVITIEETYNEVERNLKG